MTDDLFRDIPGFIEPFRPDPGESLDSAWERCPDARWMLAMAIETGARPRVVARAIVAAVRELVPELWDEPPWRGLLHVADAYGRGEMDTSAVRQLLPKDRGRILRQWVDATTRAFGAASDTIDPTVAAGLLLEALHPDVDPKQRTRIAAGAAGYLAGVPAVRARSEAHDSVLRTLEDERGVRPELALVKVPSLGSSVWDESSHRAYAEALRRCADAIRRLVPKPWAQVGGGR